MPTQIQRRQATAEAMGFDINQIPANIAIIMDGNGRWATEQGMPRFEGHRKGGKVVEDIVLTCSDMGVESLTLYSFSMQNWKRPQAEIDFLMYIYTRYLIEIRPTLEKHNVRLYHIGRTEGLPDLVVEELNRTIEITKNYTGLKLVLALNYGSREEIVDAVKKIAGKAKAGEIEIDDIDEKLISQSLDTSPIEDPDLLIRTSGEMRISNFLLWQISYSEFYVTDAYWPDFDKAELEKAIQNYANRNRRLGDVAVK